MSEPSLPTLSDLPVSEALEVEKEARTGFVCLAL
jgi:hypothetical protein